MFTGNVHLLLHNIVGSLSAIVVVILGFLVILKDSRKTVKITLGLTFLCVIIAIVSHVIGVSVSDPTLSHSILMWNISVIFVAVFNLHSAMAMLERDHEKKGFIMFVYAIGAIFAGIFIFFPETFIGMPVPKLYFPNYYTPGSLHLAFSLIFKVIIPAYLIYELATAYKYALDRIERNRFLYFTLAFSMAWGIGIIPTLLTWDIPVNPMWGLIFPMVFSVPFTYAIFRYELLNFRLLARKTSMFVLSVVAVSVLIGFFDLANSWLHAAFPEFNMWIMPVVSGLLIVATVVAFWEQLRETEILKYEFITTVTHKFRTPLTHIKWAAENIRASKSAEDTSEQLGYIESANAKLVELTDLLASATESDESMYRYRLERRSLSEFAEEIIRNSTEHADAKKIKIVREITPNVFAIFDETRLRFVLQTFVENAINYTDIEGTITVTVKNIGEEAICAVKDTGIGISKLELPLISSKLFRGAKARATDTEGMGIGLYVSKSVLARHNGRLIVDSEGEGKGSTFSFSIPAAQ